MEREQCLHWIPGADRNDQDPPDLYELLVADTDATMQARMLAVSQGLRKEATRVEKESAATEVERLTAMHRNLLDMQLELWMEHNIACRGTLGDGNCGVEMLVAFTENSSSALCVIPGIAAPRQDIQQVLQQYREELRTMWFWASGDPAWQTIWRHFNGGRVLLDPYRDVQAPADGHGTPQKSRKAMEDVATPEKDTNKVALVPGGEVPIESVTACVTFQEPEAGPPKKKKRTGKRLDPIDRVKFSKYFSIWLAERGLTYRSWFSHHCQHKVVMCLALALDFFDKGQIAAFSIFFIWCKE